MRERGDQLVETGHGDILLRHLALLHSPRAVLAVQETLAVLVQVQLGDLNLRGVDSDLDGRT